MLTPESLGELMGGPDSLRRLRRRRSGAARREPAGPPNSYDEETRCRRRGIRSRAAAGSGPGVIPGDPGGSPPRRTARHRRPRLRRRADRRYQLRQVMMMTDA